MKARGKLIKCIIFIKGARVCVCVLDVYNSVIWSSSAIRPSSNWVLVTEENVIRARKRLGGKKVFRHIRE